MASNPLVAKYMNTPLGRPPGYVDPTLSAERAIRERQRIWARERGIEVDDRGYTTGVRANLYQPLSESALAAFGRGRGNETRGRDSGPAKMRALHSSSALVVNVFDYWSGRDASPLMRALGVSGQSPTVLDLEVHLPTGLPGTPPNLDVVLVPHSGSAVAIESKFTEWLTPRPQEKATSWDAYLSKGRTLWTQAGLPRCQALAERLANHRCEFSYLDASQLLKHALGLARSRHSGGRLLYLYYDCPCTEADLHRDDIGRFAGALGGELGFEARTYQDMVGILATSGIADAAYIEYLQQRYFSGVSDFNASR